MSLTFLVCVENAMPATAHSAVLSWNWSSDGPRNDSSPDGKSRSGGPNNQSIRSRRSVGSLGSEQVLTWGAVAIFRDLRLRSCSRLQYLKLPHRRRKQSTPI